MAAAADYSTVATPANGLYIVRLALDAGAGNAREFIPPVWAGRFTVRLKKTDDTTDESGGLATSGTDGAAIGNDTMPIDAGSTYTTRIANPGQRAGGSLFLTDATGSGFAHLSFELL